nr:M15 family metallopeptidase [Lachnospiraceae bacterium]
MKKTLKIRKLLCMLCVCIIFIVSNSFIYEQINADEFSSALQSEDFEIIEDEDLLTDEELKDHGEVDEEETFTLDDVMKSDYSASAEDEDLPKDGEIGLDYFDVNDWKIVLINKQHSVPEDYEFTLGTIKTSKGSMKCDERIIPELQQMMQAAKEDGVTLVICSPYRDYERQIYLFNRKIKAYMKKQMSYLEAYRVTAQAVTVPGASEHQIGLALDIVTDTYQSLNEGFEDTDAGKWLAQHSYEYGFILRYPKGKEDITGISYEPWHFRYVGKAAAQYMYENDLTLEEFVADLQSK